MASLCARLQELVHLNRLTYCDHISPHRERPFCRSCPVNPAEQDGTSVTSHHIPNTAGMLH